jgi:hypothetical protein
MADSGETISASGSEAGEWNDLVNAGCEEDTDSHEGVRHWHRDSVDTRRVDG